MKAAGHLEANRLVGSLFHCLSVAGKMNGEGLGGLPLHVENGGLPMFIHKYFTATWFEATFVPTSTLLTNT